MYASTKKEFRNTKGRMLMNPILKEKEGKKIGKLREEQKGDIQKRVREGKKGGKLGK